MGSKDPNQTFNQIVSNIQGGQEALNKIKEYGNGDPKTAFINYAAQQGQQMLAQQIIQGLGLTK